MMTLRRVAQFVLLVTLGGCASMNARTTGRSKAGSRRESIDVGGERREFLLHVPARYRGDSAVPLVIMLHGHGDHAAKFERSTGMSAKSDTAGFIVAYPQAQGSPSVWHTAVDGSGKRDDVSFIRALIDTLSARYRIDPRRIDVAGHSNGAFMAYRLGTVMSRRIAALGISAGSIGKITADGDTVRVKRPSHPVAVIAFHGTADNSVPYDGGPESDGPRHIIPAPESIKFWVTSDQCDTLATHTPVANGAVRRDAYETCAAGTSVVLYTIVGGTHRWPGDDAEWWKFADPTAHVISATDEMWAFFVAHPKHSAPQ